MICQKIKGMNLNRDFLSIFDGLMVSDGGLSIRGRAKNACYNHTCKHPSYLHFIKNLFNENGIEVSNSYPYRYTQGATRNYCTIYLLGSCSTEWLTEQHSRWYNKKEKIVPEDIVIDELSLSHFIIGDGSIQIRNTISKGYRRNLVLCTDNLKKKYINILIHKFKELDFNPKIHKSNRIMFGVEDTNRVFSFCSPCPITCYSYKWSKTTAEYQNKECSCEIDNKQLSS